MAISAAAPAPSLFYILHRRSRFIRPLPGGFRGHQPGRDRQSAPLWYGAQVGGKGDPAGSSPRPPDDAEGLSGVRLSDRHGQRHIRNMERIAGGDPQSKIYKMLEFAGSSQDVADPWYTGDFEATYRDVTAGCEGLLKEIRKKYRL